MSILCLVKTTSISSKLRKSYISVTFQINMLQHIRSSYQNCCTRNSILNMCLFKSFPVIQTLQKTRSLLNKQTKNGLFVNKMFDRRCSASLKLKLLSLFCLSCELSIRCINGICENILDEGLM